MHRVLISLLVLCVAWLLPGGLAAAPDASAPPTQNLRHAHLSSLAGERDVELPHILDTRDFAVSGGEVRYRLSITLDAPPQRPLAILVRKMSLSGQLFLNGHALGPCERGPLQSMRCLHRPYLFVPPPSLWRVGENSIEFEIHATPHQSNGLAPVDVGDADVLDAGAYRWRHWIQVEMVQTLTWLSLLLGVLSLAVGLILPRDSVYTWFGLASISNALGNVNVLATYMGESVPLFAWFAFSSRMVSITLVFMMLLSFYGRLTVWKRRTALTYVVLAPLIIWLSDNQRSVVVALYVPALLLVPAFVPAILRWSWLSGRRVHWVVALMTVGLFVVGILDFQRLRGQSSFEGVYLSTYAYAGMLLLMGGLLMGLLASALGEATDLGMKLGDQVSERTAALEAAVQRIRRMEQAALKLTEHIPVGTYVIEKSAQGEVRFTFASDRFLQMLDLGREEVLNDPYTAFRSIHPDDLAPFMESYRQSINAIEPLSFEGRVVVAEEVHWLNVEAAPRALPEGGTAWEGVVIDVTRTKASEDALRQANEQLLHAEVERSRHEERERMLQEMHDGFGSQLASARLMVGQGAISQEHLNQVLDECMADLYLMADTLGNAENSLADALIDFRFRSQRRLSGMGIELQWHLEVDQVPDLPQHTVLQVLRIVQEALNNALRHAWAQHIRIEAIHDVRGHRLHVQVADDGVGMSRPLRQGRGMSNMRNRAREIGAELSVTDASPGTRVTLVMPLRSAGPDQRSSA